MIPSQDMPQNPHLYTLELLHRQAVSVRKKEKSDDIKIELRTFTYRIEAAQV